MGSNYMRKRVKAKSVELGSSRTIFDQASAITGSATAPLLRIEVIQLATSTRLIIHDLSERKVDRTQTAEQIWRIHGFDKDGKRFETIGVE
ncbi:MAG: hypothetical protein MUF54_05275 [Polyangiaceae bacterium]|jgi:hypothetical protein|nr:hypothetical protein [Polyangiaceae bacterium]